MVRKGEAKEVGEEAQEVFLPASVLAACAEDWDDLDDAGLSRAVGEALEHAYEHWQWLLALRRHQCRLVVVQFRDVRGEELAPHYMIGDVSVLSQWHPERALAEARDLLAQSGDGLTFDLPLAPEIVADYGALAKLHGLDDEQALELLLSAMVLLDAAHDAFVAELGDAFYVATRGLEGPLEALMNDPHGHWSAETMQVVDVRASVGQAQVWVEAPEGQEGAVAVVFQPEEEPNSI
jgi:hypothetical protein